MNPGRVGTATSVAVMSRHYALYLRRRRSNEKPTISVDLPAPRRSTLCSEKLVSGASLVSVASSFVLDRIGFF